MKNKNIYNAPVDFSTGDVLNSNNCGSFEVISNESSRNVTVRFVETGTLLSNLQRGNVIRGNVHDYNYPTVEGKGYLGKPKSSISSRSEAYVRWHGMLERCYNDKYHSTRGTYKDCSVCEEWLNFSIFETWFKENYREGYHLDKDLLVQGNRVYSPSTCCFIPPDLNTLIVEKCFGDCGTGVSKRKKKGTQDYNGRYNVTFKKVYLGRFQDQFTAEERYKEYKKLFFEEYAEVMEERLIITSSQADALRKREIT